MFARPSGTQAVIVQPIDANPPEPPAPSMLQGMWIGEVDNARVLAYETWLGASVDMMTMYAAHTYRPDAMSKLATQCTRHGGKPYKALYGINLAWPGYSTLAQVAAGSDDTLYTNMAQYMVDNGLGNADLRIGWEFNGGWYDWSMLNASLGANNKRVTWIDAYQRVADIFKGITSENFSLTWCFANDGGNNPEEAWPTYTAGVTPTAYVDYVDIDIYDQSFTTVQTWQERWNRAVNGNGIWQVGLNRGKTIATNGGAGIGLGEWGLTTRHPAGSDIDNEIFIPNLYQWCVDNDVAYQAYFHGSELNQKLANWNGSSFVDVTTYFPQAQPMYKQYFA